MALLGVLLPGCYHPPHRRTPAWDLSPGESRPERPTAQQDFADTMPLSPEIFSPQPATMSAPAPTPPLPEIRIIRRTTVTEDAPLPPEHFNPDPPTTHAGAQEPPFAGNATLMGAAENPAVNRPFFSDDPAPGTGLSFPTDPGVPRPHPPYAPEIPEEFQLPREGVTRHRLETAEFEQAWERYQAEIANAHEIPREGVRFERRIYEHWHSGHYRHADYPDDTSAVDDRWRIPTGVWKRYPSPGTAETPYEKETPYIWHPYYQSLLKGDLPILGQDVFAALFVQNVTDIEFRDIPTPSAISTARPGSAEFYGDGNQLFVNSNSSFTFEVFKGETSFKPVEWLFRIQPVFNSNYISAKETTVVSPDPRGLEQSTRPPPDNSFVVNPGDVDLLLDPLLFPAAGGRFADLSDTRATERLESYWALQQFFFETHLLDLSENYDFATMRIGTQTFNADFRGHVFLDSNLGYRLFGNLAKNRLQYNLAFFDLFEKESFSELNTWDDRDQQVFIANLYCQDFLAEGYTAQVSFLANRDRGGLEYDSAGNIARPAPIGSIAPHDVDAYYVGWNGEGHVGRLNVSHSLYHAFGEDELNGLAGDSVDISAWMGAIEFSLDTDWMRHKITAFYASGDDNATDDTAEGWDSIVDNPNLIGAPFSYWQRQGPNLGGTAVALKQRFSLVPNLRSSKFLGQSNFVNPGIFIVGVGEEWELTPRTRFFANLNYLSFVATDPISTALVTEEIDNEIGWDLSFGIQIRPLLTDNLILNAGIGLLFPGKGYKDIYKRSTPEVPGFTPAISDEAENVVYSGFVSASMTF